MAPEPTAVIATPPTEPPLRILLVEDSEAHRRIIGQVLGSSPELQVVGTASNGEEALSEVLRLQPDVVCLGLQIPRMDGFTFLRLVMSRHPLPVIVFSSSSASSKADVFKAFELGALDSVTKPDGGDAALPEIRGELLEKLRVVRALQVATLDSKGEAERPMPAAISAAPAPVPAPAAAPSATPSATPVPVAMAVEPLRLVVLGASAGGPSALQQILKALPGDLPVAMLVAQHMPERFTRPFAERLGRLSQFDVTEAQGGERILAGKVLVAPGGKHLRLERAGPGGIELRAVVVEPEPGTVGKRYCPSIDLLFESAARVMGDRVCAIVLTGMGTDGRHGIEAVKAAGGLTLAESETSAVVYGMPREAADSGSVDEVLPLDKMADRIVRFARPSRTPPK